MSKRMSKSSCISLILFVVFAFSSIRSVSSSWSSVFASIWGSTSDKSSGTQHLQLSPPAQSQIRNNTVVAANNSAAPISIVHSIKNRYLNSSTVPTKHSFDEVLVRRMKDAVKKLGRISKLIFTGDSFVYRWSKNSTVWSQFDLKYAAMNLGCPGDKTENILHRFAYQGLLTNITTNPHVVVMVGSSNVLVGDGAISVFSGVVAVVDALRAKLPESRVFVLGLLPRKQFEANQTISEVNEKLGAHFSSTTGITFLQTSMHFINQSDGNLLEDLFHSDLYYPNSAGYFVLNSLLLPHLSDLEFADRTKLPDVGRAAGSKAASGSKAALAFNHSTFRASPAKTKPSPTKTKQISGKHTNQKKVATSTNAAVAGAAAAAASAGSRRQEGGRSLRLSVD